DDVIDPACGVVAQADVADRRFAQRTELELQAVDRRPGNRPPPAAPVLAREAERRIVRAVLVIEPDETGSSPVNGVADVVDQPAVAVVPGARHLDRSHVVAPERA